MKTNLKEVEKLFITILEQIDIVTKIVEQLAEQNFLKQKCFCFHPISIDKRALHSFDYP